MNKLNTYKEGELTEGWRVNFHISGGMVVAIEVFIWGDDGKINDF